LKKDTQVPYSLQDEMKSGLLAVVQTAPKLGLVPENLTEMESALAGLPDYENRLVVFPEMATSGYYFGMKDQLWRLAEPVPGGPTTQKLIEMAVKNNCYLIIGLPERDGKALYNCAVLVGPEGYITKYRKLHLWDKEKLLYEPGNLGLVIADLPIGRVGLIICYDLWFPEQARLLRLLGADLIAMPAALVWNDTPSHIKHGYYMANYVAMATAQLNQVYLAMASQVGRYGDRWLFGSSIIATPYGWPLTEPADDAHPSVLHGEVNFLLGRQLRGWSEMDHFDNDRRTDVYGQMLGYVHPSDETIK
jgi:N-carbamoylputrescine amidase